MRQNKAKKIGQDKVVAKVLLQYPHVNDSVVPSSVQELETANDLDSTGSWDHLLESLESITNRTELEEVRLERVRHAIRLTEELGLTKKEAVERVGL